MLRLPERSVVATSCQELPVRAAFDDRALVQHDDLVCVNDGRKPVRDDERRAVAGQIHQVAKDLPLGPRIQRRRRFIEDKEQRSFQSGPCDGHALPLTSGELQPALAHQRVVTLGQPHNEVVKVRETRSGLDLVLGCIEPAEGDVVSDRVMEQNCVLRHDRDCAADFGQRHLRRRPAIEKNGAGVRGIQPEQQADQR